MLGGDTIVVGAFEALKDSRSRKLTDDMFLPGVDGDNEALELIKAGGAYKLSIAFAWTLMQSLRLERRCRALPAPPAGSFKLRATPPRPCRKAAVDSPDLQS